jgi:hypothetical protein
MITENDLLFVQANQNNTQWDVNVHDKKVATVIEQMRAKDVNYIVVFPDKSKRFSFREGVIACILNAVRKQNGN